MVYQRLCSTDLLRKENPTFRAAGDADDRKAGYQKNGEIRQPGWKISQVTRKTQNNGTLKGKQARLQVKTRKPVCSWSKVPQKHINIAPWIQSGPGYCKNAEMEHLGYRVTQMVRKTAKLHLIGGIMRAPGFELVTLRSLV